MGPTDPLGGVLRPEDGLGHRFRELRKSRELSLTDVADATEISSSFLSLFETGKCDITFGRLTRLIEFFGVSITDLIPDPEPQQSIVVHREHRRRLQSRSERATAELLTHHTRHGMLPLLVTLEAGGRIADSFDPELGERFLLVLKGRIEIDNRQNEPIQLRAGDAAYFLTNQPMTFRNIGRAAAEWFSVQTRITP